MQSTYVKSTYLYLFTMWVYGGSLGAQSCDAYLAQYWDGCMNTQCFRWREGDIVKAMDANIRFYITYFARYSPYITIDTKPDVEIFWSPVADSSFNFIHSSQFSPNQAPAAVAPIITSMRERNVPFVWWTGPGDTPDNLDQLLTEQGLVAREEYVGMYCDLTQRTMPATIHDLVIKRVANQQDLRDFYYVQTQAEQSSLLWDCVGRFIPIDAYGASASIELYVGYRDSKPVSAGALALYADIAGIYTLATVPAERNNGYATVLMRTMLERARQHTYCYAALQASAQAYSLYSKLGFEPCCIFKGYS